MKVQLGVTMPRLFLSVANEENEARPYVTVDTDVRMPYSLGLRLVAVYDARWYADEASDSLANIWRWDKDAGAAVKLVKEQAKRGGMVIFASPVHAEQANGNMDAWWGVLRRVLRMLHEVGLTAEQQNTDALVIAPVVRKDKRQLEAMSLLYLINATGPQRLARREAGLKNFR